jgi:predicted nucleotidyltransferase
MPMGDRLRHVERNAMVATLSRILAPRADVTLALLFGSHARGVAGNASDIDLAVLGRDLDPFELGAEISLATGREVDVVMLEDAGVPLLEQIVRDGVVVHEGLPHAGSTWRAGALASLETDRPWYARMRKAMLARLAAPRAG